LITLEDAGNLEPSSNDFRASRWWIPRFEIRADSGRFVCQARPDINLSAHTGQGYGRGLCESFLFAFQWCWSSDFSRPQPSANHCSRMSTGGRRPLNPFGTPLVQIQRNLLWL